MTIELKSIVDLSGEEAATFFLKNESYFSFDLPKYFSFSNILNGVDGVLKKKLLSSCVEKGAVRRLEGVNYTILGNKDGQYAWRKFQLIHPALYVSLVHEITKKDNWELIVGRFRHFGAIKGIDCFSIPLESSSKESDKGEQVKRWSEYVEKGSIIQSLDFDYIVHADIADCYPSIYTHSIPWALHTKEVAKKEMRNMDLIGNIIDKHIQDMNHGQTNGIPQGSVLMDFIAEMVLGLADEEISKRIKEVGLTDYQIIRYRDDYRIFSNSSVDGDIILKNIMEVLCSIGLKLNPTKIVQSNDVVLSSLKSDKLSSMGVDLIDECCFTHLMNIYQFSLKFPNTGSLIKFLKRFGETLVSIVSMKEPSVLIGIVVSISLKNPRSYPDCAALISKLLSFVSDEEKEELLNKIMMKFSNVPNSEYMQIWLQRICKPLNIELEFTADMCRIASGAKNNMWCSDWISSEKLKNICNDNTIVDTEIYNDLEVVMSKEEIDLFLSSY